MAKVSRIDPTLTGADDYIREGYSIDTGPPAFAGEPPESFLSQHRFSLSSSNHLSPSPSTRNCPLPSPPLLVHWEDWLSAAISNSSDFFLGLFSSFSSCSGVFCRGRRRGLSSALPVPRPSPPTLSLFPLSPSSDAHNVAMPLNPVGDAPAVRPPCRGRCLRFRETALANHQLDCA